MGRADDALPVMIWTDALGGETLGFHKNSLINEELKKEKPDVNRLNVLLKSLEQNKGTIPAAKLNKKIGEINALISKLADGKTVFYKDIGKEFLDQNGGLSGEIMPDYLHLSAKGYDIWGKAIKGDIEKLVK
jgi:lysophospholipase L1-like esterase